MTNNDEERGKKENKCHNRDKIKIKIVQWQKCEKILENTIKKRINLGLMRKYMLRMQ